LETKLNLEQEKVDRARRAAESIAKGVMEEIKPKTTVAVERTILRLLGVDGIDIAEVPLPNVVVEKLQEAQALACGAAHWMGRAILATGKSPQEIAREVAEDNFDLLDQPLYSNEEIRRALEPYVREGLEWIRDQRRRREKFLETLGTGPKPLLYVIVATGDIYEDVIQAKSAAEQGADIVAVIRSTAQSLLDYVPYGATREGFGGTFATQENFRIMRQGLDEVGEELGRYIYLVNYCSGLSMPEIAAMGALERLDMMLNDAMYGILFRDINMQRTFIDQHFSRMINGYAGIIINTGEDNYLTTADPYEAAHTVLASQFINEQLGLRSGLKNEQLGLGHAFELDPEKEDGWLLEVAQAQMAREIFPNAPLKYMPPTKYMTGDIFKTHLVDGMFNLAGVLTGQEIQLLGMLTEAIHTPHIHDRSLAIDNARYIMNNARHLGEEIYFKPGGRIQERAQQVLDEALEMLEKISDLGLPRAISEGWFGGISRSPQGGKGLEGVVEKEENYFNPFMEEMSGEREGS